MPEYLINSFAAGELGPKLYGRMDLQQYRAGCRRLENMLVLPEGGATRRPGTHYVSNVKTDSKKVRLYSLQHNALEATVIEVGDSYLRFYKDGAQIEDGGSPYEIVGPWSESDLPDIDFAQWGDDELFIVHPDYAPRILTRTSDTSWALSTPSFVGITTALSYIIDTVDDTNDVVTLVNDPSLTDTVAVQMKIASGGASDALPNGVDSDETTYYVAWDSTNSGYALYETISDAQADTNRVNFTDTGTGTFALFIIEEFRLTDHFPSWVTTYEQRLIMGGTNFAPNSVYGSRIVQPLDFSNDDGTDADGWVHSVYRSQYDDVLWVVGETALLAGATNSLWRIGGPESILSGNATPVIQAQSGIGCSRVEPIFFQDYIVFAERGGKRIRTTTYEQAREKHITEDMTQLAPHITESGVAGMTYSQLPFPILWAWREDGKVITLSFSQTLGVAAWSEHSFSGEVEQMVSIPHHDSTSGLYNNDRVWMVVKRTINGSVERHIEYIDFAGWEDPDYAWYVDSGVGFTGTSHDITGITAASPAVVTVDDATGISNGDKVRINGCTEMTELNGNVYTVANLSGSTFELQYLDGSTDVDMSGHGSAEGSGATAEIVQANITGLSHLEGEEVSSLVDGGSIANETVSSGEVDLDRHGRRVVTGLYIRPVLQPMPMAAQPTSKKVISEIYVRFYQSGAVKVGPDADNLQPLTFTNPGYEFGQSSEYYTGSRLIEFAGGYSRDGDMYITQDYPLPLTILSVAAVVEIA